MVLFYTLTSSYYPFLLRLYIPFHYPLTLIYCLGLFLFIGGPGWWRTLLLLLFPLTPVSVESLYACANQLPRSDQIWRWLPSYQHCELLDLGMYYSWDGENFGFGATRELYEHELYD